MIYGNRNWVPVYIYGTTPDFLRYFGLNDLEDLPRLKELQGLVEGDPNQVQMTFEESQSHPEPTPPVMAKPVPPL